ncbi:ABC transporter substrate-binding protein [Breoghania sp. L-A4]|uniref:ABC transporter substrate-binding protein n=1 Tax=Breoghania sp. L-A4 TaxID=2304600 RepID=UPI0013C2C918|nr:ABC transporter substrate-binding protein [Breoghania sp. L-A4]
MTSRASDLANSAEAAWSRRRVLACLGAWPLAAGAFGAVPAIAETGPLRFTHTFGETVLPGPARRVVSLGYTTHDALLALGVPPVAVRYWFGDFSYGVWPWAQPYLGDARPFVLTGEVAMERVAALKPDLIVGIGSGISRAEYQVLSHIAPVLMHEDADTSYGMPWDVMTRTLGRALGKSAQAEILVSGVREKFSAARARHPDWAGKTAVPAYHWGGETGAFVGADSRARFFIELGFQPTPAVANLSGPSGFYAPLSPEDLSPLDADILVWISSYGAVPDLVALPMRRTLRAHIEGGRSWQARLSPVRCRSAACCRFPSFSKSWKPI